MVDEDKNLPQHDTDEQPLKSPLSQATSPIRPQHPDPVRPRLAPSVNRPTKPKPSLGNLNEEQPAATAPQGLPSEQQAAVALENLRKKMQAMAQEYADGKINQAQFNAVYRRYSEQSEIVQRILERDPQSDAWQSAVVPGHTGFLLDHFEAKIASFGIYLLRNGELITLQGKVRLPDGQLAPVFERLRGLVQQGHKIAPAWRVLKDKSWVLMVPGKLAVSVAIFSLEPAIIQRRMVTDSHRDFERANQRILRQDVIDRSSLVYPHRALLV